MIDDMILDLDLQLFADEPEEAGTSEAGHVELAGQESEPGASSEPIPPELEGLSEEAAREAMVEAQGQTVQESADSGAIQDSETKPDANSLEQPKAKVPYLRFKEMVDKKNGLEARNRELENKLAEYEQRFGGNRQVQTSAVPTSQTPQLQQSQGLNITPEIAQKIQAAVKQRAMQISGFTEDDIESLAYAEENDDRQATWKYAREFAQQEIVGKIRQAQQDRISQARAFLANHQKMEAEFNDYASKAMAEEDFPQIQEFAEKNLLKQLPEADQQVIGDAYRRIVNHVGSGQDYYTIKNFYNAAKNAYRSGGAKQAKAAVAKRKAAANMPRAEKVQGTQGGSGAVTVESLLDMANNTPWGKIPPNYRDMLMGITPVK